MKKFYKNTLMSGAFSKALRIVALLCVLIGVSSSAWGTTYYLWYNAKTNEPNYKDGNFTMSAGATLTNNKCVWTISNLRKDNSYFYISTSSTYSESNLKGVDIKFNYPEVQQGINGYGKQNYGTKVGFYISNSNANSTVTITIDFSNSSQYIISPTTGAVTCTPSGTITGATYDGTKVTLTGNITEVCSGSVTYGFDYSTDGKTWNNISSSTISKTGTVTKEWTAFKKGTTYYFRLKVNSKTDNNTKVLDIPSEGSDDDEYDCTGILYLKPNDNWKKDKAWFAARFWTDGGSEEWVKMTAASCTGLYYVKNPGSYNKVIFCRMNPASSAMTWDNKWNQTGDLVIPTDGKNQFTIPVGAWDESTTTWSKSDCTDGCIPPPDPITEVLLSHEAIVNKSSKTASVYGYLQSTDCDDNIVEYGFYFCDVNDGSVCKPVASEEKKWPAIGSGTTPLLRGTEFSANVTGLEEGKSYFYRAYAKINGKPVLSQEVRELTLDPCKQQVCCADPVIYTVNASPEFSENKCKLHFKSLQDALDHLKESASLNDDYQYVTKDGDSYNLNQPVIIKVVYYDDQPEDETMAYAYRGTTDYGMTAGNVAPDNVNLIKDFNKSSLANPKNTLTIKAGTSKAKPWIHHIVIRNSKNITLDSLCIYSDPNGKKDNALEIDINSSQWDLIKIQENNCVSYTGSNNNGTFTHTNMCEANILIQNCMIGSAGFTGFQVSGYDGITFKNNDIEASFADASERANIINWGASAKFMACKNIKFIQNNFRGSQPTLLWLQDSQNALFMNNVFWNTNTFLANSGEVTPAAIKIVNQYGVDIDNIGIFYNTFFFANNGEKSGSGYNFFTQFLAKSPGSVPGTQYFKENIYFQYNNCYSYDEDCPGSDAFINSAEIDGGSTKNYKSESKTTNKTNFCPNNFWTVLDPDNTDRSKFDFTTGCDLLKINVKSQVCKTTASGPASLIVKGTDMNLGEVPDYEFTGITLTNDELRADRYLAGVRPDSLWTYGAYQSKKTHDVETIYWVGVSNIWDDRNNWEYEEVDASGKTVRQRVSCVTNLSPDLHVVVEEIGSVEVSGGRKWPKLPSSFADTDLREQESIVKDGDLGVPAEEQVNAGKTNKFASYIELEYGAGIMGVENLVNGEVHYDSASTKFVSPRSQWILVGPSIKPFDRKTSEKYDVRDLESGDYYIENHEPHVYMHQAHLNEGNQVQWGSTFGDLNKTLAHNTVFAMQIPDQYGDYKFSSEFYYEWINPNKDMLKDGIAPKEFTFNGRFYNESDLPKYENLEKGKSYLLTNTYPSNIDADLLNSSGKGTVRVYSYTDKEFKALGTSRISTPILSQHGFVFTSNIDGTLEIPKEYFLNTITRHRSIEVIEPSCRIKVKNLDDKTASSVVITIDELKEDEANYGTDAPKIFNSMDETLPDMYVMRYDKEWSGIRIPTMAEPIPLGIRVSKSGAKLEFVLDASENMGDVILEDRGTGIKYNLSNGEVCTVSDLVVGDSQGRFFLYLSEEDEKPEIEDPNDDNVATDIEEENADKSEISIIGTLNGVVVSCSSDIELQTIYINDMSGKTAMFNVSGQFAEIELPVAQGVYTVNVIADKATRTGKVILK